MSLRLLGRVVAGQLRSRSLWGPKTTCKMSTSASLVNVSTDDKTGVATLEMNRPPVNSLNFEKMTEMNIALEKLENDKQCRGVILTSSAQSVFSAGLDIREMHQPKEDRLREFWRSFQNLWMRLYGSRLITVAAINGHCPAGGCILSMSCDYRVMADGKFAIGLNETSFGIAAPVWAMDLMVKTIGQRVADDALQLGKMFSTQQALEVGLIDEMVPQNKVMEAAHQEMEKWLKIPDHARVLTKDYLRKPLVQKLAARQEEDIDSFVNYITNAKIQKGLGIYLELLNKRKG